jgi:peptidoglycan hydrolase CwlO-like protein
VTDSDMLIFGTPDEMSRYASADSEPLLVIRDVVSKLKDENVSDALAILNNLRERMEDGQSTWSKHNNPLSPIDKENSVPNTPVVDRTRPHIDSQLEELRERLEVVIEERDEQEDLANSLKEELAKKELLIDEQKEEIALHKRICDDLTTQLTDTMEVESGPNTPNTPTPKKSAPSTDDGSSSGSSSSVSGKVTSPASEGTREVINKYMENQLDLNAVEQGEHERMVEELLSKLEVSRKEVEERDKQLVEMRAELENAQEEIEEQEGVEADLKSRMLVLESTLLNLRGGDEVVTRGRVHEYGGPAGEARRGEGPQPGARRHR